MGLKCSNLRFLFYLNVMLIFESSWNLMDLKVEVACTLW